MHHAWVQQLLSGACDDGSDVHTYIGASNHSTHMQTVPAPVLCWYYVMRQCQLLLTHSLLPHRPQHDYIVNFSVNPDMFAFAARDAMKAGMSGTWQYTMACDRCVRNVLLLMSSSPLH